MFAGQRRGRPVFISYARATGTHGAVALHAALGGAAGLAFLDTSAIGPGDSIPLVVFESLLAARVLVVLIDATYFTRRYCMQELRVGLWAFQVLSERGGDRLGESLRPIVIGLPLDGAGPGVMDRLPPAARESNWPATADPHRLAALVRTRLADVETTIGERLERLGELASLWDRVRAAVDIPPPKLLNAVPVYPPTGLVPSLGEGFIGRATELWRIHTALTLGNGPRGAALTGSLEGGGGFGKSRLAAEYLHRFGPANFPGGLFWIDADVPEDRVEAQLHGVLRTLHPGTPELSEFRRQGRDAGRELAGALSGHERRDPVLFVVDGVPEPEAGRPPRPLSTWCPAIGQVSTLVTSRFRRSLNGDIRSLPVAELSSEAAVALLTHEHGGRAAVSQGAWLRVADWVGHLPLALELLNAALRAGAVTAAELVAMAGRAGPAVELDRQMEALRGQVPAGSLRGVTEALLVSYERLSVPARCSARAMAALAPDPIPLALVTALGQEMMSRSVRADLTVRSLVMPVLARDVPMFGRMHPVLADFLRSCAGDHTGEHPTLCEALIDVMTADACRDPAAWPLMDACRPHAEALLRRVDEEGTAELAPRLIQLGGRVALLLSEQGRLDRASAAGEAILARTAAALGPDHAQTHRARGNLALHLLRLGDLGRSRALQEEALAGLRRRLGEEHLDTVWARASLATILDALGDPAGAAPLHREVLDARRRSLGDDHEDTAATRSNLASTLRALGDLQRASELAEGALETLRRVRGDDHRDTLALKGNVAGLRRELGDLEGAVTLAAEVLAGSRRLLGDDHPDTLTAKMSLAQLRSDQGDMAGAEALEREVLETRRLLLGEDHPDTLFARLQLSVLLRDRGKLVEARVLAEAAYRGRLRRLGAGHPETLDAMGHLSVLRQETGDGPGASALAEELLVAQRARFGLDDPRTTRTMAFLGAVAYASGDLGRARALTQEALEGRARRLGEDHPETLAAKAQFAALLLDVGDLEEARSLQTEVLEASRRRLGEDHPATLSAAHELAATLAALGDGAGARELAEAAVLGRRRRLGSEHADTAAAEETLAAILADPGEPASPEQAGDAHGARRRS